jgi:hypothetical protein
MAPNSMLLHSIQSNATQFDPMPSGRILPQIELGSLPELSPLPSVLPVYSTL